MIYLWNKHDHASVQSDNVTWTTAADVTSAACTAETKQLSDTSVTACYYRNIKNCSLSVMLTATDQKSLKRWYYPPSLASHRLKVNVMLGNIITFNDFFCGFWSVAVNIMDRVQFLIFVFAVLLPNLCNACNYRISLLNTFTFFDSQDCRSQPH